MESTTNNLVKTLTESIPEKISTFEEPSVNSSVNSSVDSSPDSTSTFSKIVMFFIIGSFLFFLGIIVFIYFKKGDLSFEDYLKTQWLLIVNRFIDRKQTEVDKVDIKDTEKEQKIEKIEKIEKKVEVIKEKEKTCDNPKKNDLVNALDNAAQTSNYMADESSSNIQSANKSRWCLIGEAKGVRNCVELEESQECMSGDIFPTNDVCINPNLRF